MSATHLAATDGSEFQETMYTRPTTNLRAEMRRGTNLLLFPPGNRARVVHFWVECPLYHAGHGEADTRNATGRTVVPLTASETAKRDNRGANRPRVSNCRQSKRTGPLRRAAAAPARRCPPPAPV